MNTPIRQRFDEKWTLETTRGCHVWTAGMNKAGYGLFGMYRDGKWRSHLANRVAWELNKGPIPEGLHVLHTCDNPPCVNPAHLFLGTHDDNMKDMRAKGRHMSPLRLSRLRRGTDVHLAKLTDDKVRDIRRQLFNGVEGSVIAAQYGVTPTIISRIKTGKIWKHVLGDLMANQDDE